MAIIDAEATDDHTGETTDNHADETTVIHPDETLKFTLPFQITERIHRQEIPFILSPQNPANEQRGRVVVITGGGTGIGAACAKVWVDAHARGVVITGRRHDVLERTATALQAASGSDTLVKAIPADVTVEDDMHRVFEEVKQTFGKPADLVIANAGIASSFCPSAEEDVSRWWQNFQVNVLGLHLTVTSWIQSQDDRRRPRGTLIHVNSGMAGLAVPGISGYGTSKLAAHRYMECIATDYPTLRTFTILPGIVDTGQVKEEYFKYAHDHPALVGSWALYLVGKRADYLRGSLVSVNWDIPKLELRRKEIEEGVLKMSWVPALPCCGGRGFE